MARKEKKTVSKSARQVSRIGMENWMDVAMQVAIKTQRSPEIHSHVGTKSDAGAGSSSSKSVFSADVAGFNWLCWDWRSRNRRSCLYVVRILR